MLYVRICSFSLYQSSLIGGKRRACIYGRMVDAICSNVCANLCVLCFNCAKACVQKLGWFFVFYSMYPYGLLYNFLYSYIQLFSCKCH